MAKVSSGGEGGNGLGVGSWGWEEGVGLWGVKGNNERGQKSEYAGAQGTEIKGEKKKTLQV